MMDVSKLYDTVWKKCLIVFVVIFTVVMCCGFLSIDYLSNVIIDSHVHSDSIVVSDKYINNNTNDDYVVVDVYNRTFVINNNDNDYDKKLFNAIKPGEKYDVTIKEPAPDDVNQIYYILQVHYAG